MGREGQRVVVVVVVDETHAPHFCVLLLYNVRAKKNSKNKIIMKVVGEETGRWNTHPSRLADDVRAHGAPHESDDGVHSAAASSGYGGTYRL